LLLTVFISYCRVALPETTPGRWATALIVFLEGIHGDGRQAGGPVRDDACEQSESDVDRRILQAVRSLDYGSVEVIVHDSRIVQIERREKVRFDKTTVEQPRP